MNKLFLIAAVMLASTKLQAQDLKTVAYTDGTQKLNGLVTSNSGSKKPGVLILPAWLGIDQEAKDAALALEKEGYIAFVADIYGEGHIPTNNQEAMKIAGSYKNDYKAYQGRIAAALEALKKSGASADKIAVIGYCFGGSGALEAARANFPVQGVVSIHGGLDKDASRANGAIKTKVLVENPAEDQTVKPEHIAALKKELTEGKADWQFITYASTGHTFTNPQSPEYNKLMADRAWSHTLLFLKEVLQ